jgi:type II secretory pathway component PulJ
LTDLEDEMKRAVVGLIVVLFFAIASIAVARADSGASATSADSPMAKLRVDLRKAVENGRLSDAQQETMRNVAATLRQAAEARQQGQKVDRGAVKKAFSDIKDITNSDAFQPEDKQAVKADLEAVKEHAKEARAQRRHFLFGR